MAKKAVKARKTVRTRKSAKATTASPAGAARTKSLALKPPVFHVSLQKVLEKMTAIANSPDKEEFQKRCAELKGDRFVIANARIVQLVKEFAPSRRQQDIVVTTSLESNRASDDETCFEKPGNGPR
jgi:hypothetical protein